MAITTTYELGVSALTGTIIIESALRKIGVLQTGRAATPDELISTLITLNQVLKTFDSVNALKTQVKHESSSLTVVGGTSHYELPAEVRWVEVATAYDGTVHTPMTLLTSAQYAAIVDKTAEGIPTSIYVSHDAATPDVRIHPTPNTAQVAAGADVDYWYRRKVGILGAVTESIDLPDEYVRAITYMLAKDLALEYNIAGDIKQLVFQEADIALKVLILRESELSDSMQGQ